jgi:hypothetical protein
MKHNDIKHTGCASLVINRSEGTNRLEGISDPLGDPPGPTSDLNTNKIQFLYENTKGIWTSNLHYEVQDRSKKNPFLVSYPGAISFRLS